MTNKKNSQHGRKQNQKLKPYLVMQYLLQESDEQNAIPASAIIEHLNDLGISAEKKSIYRDIQAINKAMLIAENSRDGEIYTIYTEPSDFIKVKDALEQGGINEFLTSEITYVADNKISLDDEKSEKVMNLIEALEAIDDVQDVYHNMEV